MKEDFYLS